MLFIFSTIILLALLPAAAQAYTIENTNAEANGRIAMTQSTSLHLDPGATASADMQITNQTGQKVDLVFHLEDFVGSRNPAEGLVFLQDQNADRGARNWLTPEIKKISLENGQALTFKVDVRVPEDAEPGGRYAAMISSTTVQTENGPRPYLNRSLYFIRVAGEIDMQGHLNAFEVPKLSASGNINFGVVFGNSGKIHLEPSGRITVIDLFGRVAADLPVEKWLVLPDANRRATVAWGQGWRIGRYTAVVDIEYAGSDAKLVATRSFWIIPWEVILFFSLVIAVFFFMLFREIRSRSS